MDKLQSYQTFIKVAETKSFSLAAQALYLSQPSVSRIVADLESSLKTRLFHRSTKAPILTLEGKKLYQSLKPLLDAFEHTDATFRNKTQPLSGTIRISVPIFMPKVFYPLFSNFLLDHPHVRIQLSASNAYTDLEEGGFDLAVRIGKDPYRQKAFHYEQISDRQMGFFTSPSYQQKKGRPSHPEELVAHNCLQYTPFGEASPWIYLEKKTQHALTVSGQLEANTMIALVDALESGLGIAYLPTYYVKKLEESKKAIPILKDFWPTPQPIYVVYRNHNYLPQLIRVLISFLKTNTSTALLDHVHS